MKSIKENKQTSYKKVESVREVKKRAKIKDIKGVLNEKLIFILLLAIFSVVNVSSQSLNLDVDVSSASDTRVWGFVYVGCECTPFSILTYAPVRIEWMHWLQSWKNRVFWAETNANGRYSGTVNTYPDALHAFPYVKVTAMGTSVIATHTPPLTRVDVYVVQPCDPPIIID